MDDDFLGENVGIGKIVGLFEALVAELDQWSSRKDPLSPGSRHLEKQQKRQLLRACPESFGCAQDRLRRRIVAIAHPVIPQDVAVVPEFLDD